jgi:hypothetical protein
VRNYLAFPSLRRHIGATACAMVTLRSCRDRSRLRLGAHGATRATPSRLSFRAVRPMKPLVPSFNLEIRPASSDGSAPFA